MIKRTEITFLIPKEDFSDTGVPINDFDHVTKQCTLFKRDSDIVEENGVYKNVREVKLKIHTNKIVEKVFKLDSNYYEITREEPVDNVFSFVFATEKDGAIYES